MNNYSIKRHEVGSSKYSLLAISVTEDTSQVEMSWLKTYLASSVRENTVQSRDKIKRKACRCGDCAGIEDNHYDIETAAATTAKLPRWFVAGR
jgi:hypothetical protein